MLREWPLLCVHDLSIALWHVVDTSLPFCALGREATATFFVRVAGESMQEAGIHSGDVLIVDRALTLSDGSGIIAIVNGELTVKRLSKRQSTLILMPENQQYPPLAITEATAFELYALRGYVGTGDDDAHAVGSSRGSLLH